MNSVEFFEVQEKLPDMKAWQTFVAGNKWVYDPAYIDSIASSAALRGVYSNFSGSIFPALVNGKNYRESIVSKGLNSRARAVLDEVVNEVGDDLSRRILALEAVTPFALSLRGKYPYSICTEYLRTEKDRERHFPIPHLDLINACFPDHVFDVVVSHDVLVHVPRLTRALSETCRILKSGGVCLATFPFAYNSQEISIRAVATGDKVVHLFEPEYHGNPVDSHGSLVFQVLGWDILDVCRNAGFRTAEILFVSSGARGITGADCAGIFILRAVA